MTIGLGGERAVLSCDGGCVAKSWGVSKSTMTAGLYQSALTGSPVVTGLLNREHHVGTGVGAPFTAPAAERSPWSPSSSLTLICSG